VDEQRFDRLSRRFARFQTRREALKAVAGTAVGLAAGTRATAAMAQECTPHYASCAADDACCAGSVCEYGLCMPGCRIDGIFTNAWMSAPDNICGQCLPELSTTSWSPANEGMSCWSGDPNAGTTTCQNGACGPVALVNCPATSVCQLEGSVDPLTGLCVNPPVEAGAPCGNAGMCHGNMYQPADACDGNGFCVGGGSQTVSCAPYLCGTEGCLTSCAADSDCIDGAHCDDNVCLADEGLGRPCDEDSDCATGVCSDGVCCNQRCDGLCEVCSAENGGFCTPVRCPATDQCHDDGVCDPATGQCSNPARPDGFACTGDNKCVTGDTCQAGVCVNGQQPVICDSGNPCIVDSCDPEVGCVQQFKIEGASCDDGNPCDGNEICDGAGHCVEGTPVVCQPPDQCHEAGVCDPGTGECVYDMLPNGTSCNDNNSCTYNDTCQEGVCTGTPADLNSDPNNCGQCGYRCATVGSNICSSGRCCGNTSAGSICCGMGYRPTTCTYLCGTYPCNCYYIPYTCNCREVFTGNHCGSFGTSACYETVCDTCYDQQCNTCYQYCDSPCCQ